MRSTRKPVEELSGRALDAAVAEGVFGCEVRNDPVFGPTCSCSREHARSDPPHGLAEGNRWTPSLHEYSTDIGTAWQVVEKLVGEGWAFRLDAPRWIHSDGIVYADGEWEAIFAAPEKQEGDYADAEHAAAATVPEAICQAALKAVRARDA